MLNRTLSALKKKPVPLQYGRKDFFKKMRNPRASKPWRDRHVMSGGRVEVTSSTDALTETGDTVMGSLTSGSVLGMRTPHLGPQAARQALLSMAPPSTPPLRSQGSFPLASSSSSTTAALSTTSGASQLPSLSQSAPYGAEAGAVQPVLSSSSSMLPGTYAGSAVAGSPGVQIPFGKALNLQVEAVDTYESEGTLHGTGTDGVAAASGPAGGVPIHLQHLKTRSRKEVADAILLPRHINKLFHKIMGWSEDLAELDAESDAAAGPSEDSPQVLRKKMSNLTEKMKYGVLLDAYEKDTFAMEHQLELAGARFEKKFLEWEGVHVLDQDAAAEMASVQANKASIVMDAPNSQSIPVVGRDCCPGCGTLLQNTSTDDFGYVKDGEVERYILERERKLQARHEYATRMAELHAHWEKHGRQVGEEWLDFMTQDEFDAFYRDRQTPFVCHRCHALENLGVVGRRKVMSAPDFTEQLRALKEKSCVVVLVVDITDFPGSMVYDLPGLISMNNKVIIAVNKMDCVRNRSFQYKGKDKAVASALVPERYVRRWVEDIATQFGLPSHQIARVVPVSAKRGWNMDKLLAAIEETSNLNLRRPSKPLPTYLVGVANTGKSSLINALAHHLYIPQPPHPQSKKVYYTRPDAKTGTEAVFWRWYTPPNANQAEMLDVRARHDKKASKLVTVSSLPGTTVSTNAVRLSLTTPNTGTGGPHGGAAELAATQANTFLYDTPGLLPHWHHSSPLTLLQMRRTLMRKFRNPQCFLLLPGHTVFLGGVAAIDIVKGPSRGLLFMLYTSQKTRNAIVRTDRADAFWSEQLGKSLDPPGSMEQLTADGGTAALSESKTYLFECYGTHRRRPKADVYVCGLGWASFCVSESADVVLRVRTLPGVIHGIREPLRYKDLQPFRFWPKLRRRFTSKGIEDAESEDGDADSIHTIVRLTAGASSSLGAGATPTAHATAPTSAHNHDGKSSDPASPTTGTETPVVEVVAKASHPVYQSTSSAPLDDLVRELQSAGQL